MPEAGGFGITVAEEGMEHISAGYRTTPVYGMSCTRTLKPEALKSNVPS
jgi:hypothetical protein